MAKAESSREDLVKRIQELEQEVAHWKSQIKNQRYGLNWLEVPEKMENENAIPILEEVKEKAIKNDDGKPTHILIEGDNYHALQCLNYTHRSKVDVIYIDPPYNTGSTKTEKFVYKDSRFLKEYPDGKVIAKDDPCRHSSWLSFMNKRLKLAKNLLSDKGVIFISIDDNEQANLKLLCDQIFGEKNFVGSYFWKRTNTPPALSKKMRRKLEYVLCFQKNDNEKRIFAQGFIDGGDAPLLNTDNPLGVLKFPKGTVRFSIPDGIYSSKKTHKIKLLEEVVVQDGLNVNDFSAQAHFKWGQDNLNEEVSEGTYFLVKSKQFSIRYQKSSKSTKVPSNIIDNEVNVGTNENSKKELEELGLKDTFDFPKPTSLMSYLIKMPFWDKDKILILDFFAGSGTTMHATMQLNAEDGGHRQCILVQAPETTWEIKDGVKQAKENSVEAFKAGFNTISDITYERNRRIIEGYTNAKGEHVEGLGNSLKYYKTAFVGERSAKSALDEDRMALAAKAGCLIALAENSLETVECNGKDFYQIFTDEKQKYTCVYFNGDYSEFSEFVKEIENIRSKNKRAKFNVYAFSWGSGDDIENEFDDLRNVNIKPIPAPILDIYKTLNA